jgi:flavin-dependent dehydrogenase
VVVGGGPAGCAAAATACSAGLDVVLYSAGPPLWMRPRESLPPGAAHLVDELFGPGAFRPEDHLQAYANESRWGSAELERADFIFNPFGHGWHLDRPAFDRALLNRARRMGVSVLEQRVATVGEARFVVDATGRSARIARSRGARRRRFDRLVAVWREDRERAASVTTVTAERDGWSYTAPGIGAFLTDADLLPRVPGQATDASTSCLDRVVGPGWAATGDAAVAFDPLSSQGLVTALVMGREAGGLAAGLVRTSDYEAEYQALLDEHLSLRRAYYALETRWPDSPFWARRHLRAPLRLGVSSAVTACRFVRADP